MREYIYRQRTACRVVREHERLWIEVEGTSVVVEVRCYTGRRWAGPSAYWVTGSGLA